MLAFFRSSGALQDPNRPTDFEVEQRFLDASFNTGPTGKKTTKKNCQNHPQSSRSKGNALQLLTFINPQEAANPDRNGPVGFCPLVSPSPRVARGHRELALREVEMPLRAFKMRAALGGVGVGGSQGNRISVGRKCRLGFGRRLGSSPARPPGPTGKVRLV